MATISSLLRDHVTLQVRSVDRLFLQGYVPRLQTQGQVIRFLLDRGFPIPSPAVLGKIGRDYVKAIERLIGDHEIPVVRFAKGDVKEEIAREYFKRAEQQGRYGVVLVGVAQEKTSAWRGWRDGGPDGHPHFEYRRQSIFPNNYYFYIRDPDWGPSFIKTVAYAPFSVWVYLNGNEWAKQQAARQGIEFTALDNGFAACEDQAALAGICQRLSAADVWAFFARWQARLPSPFTAEDRRRGYGHELAFRQLELSDTHVFDRPAAGRAWFERTLPDQLTLGRPDQVAIVFGRRVSRQTPGRFHTKIITAGVEPAIQVHYRASKVKQYFKEGARAAHGDDRQRHARLRRRPPPDRRQLGRAGASRTRHQPATARPPTRRLPMRARRHDARARGAAVHPRRPTRPRTALRRTAHDGAARLPVLLRAPVRRTDQPQPARADRRTDPGLRRAPDDLRPAPPTPQRPDPPHRTHPHIRAH